MKLMHMTHGDGHAQECKLSISESFWPPAPQIDNTRGASEGEASEVELSGMLQGGLCTQRAV